MKFQKFVWLWIFALELNKLSTKQKQKETIVFFLKKNKITNNKMIQNFTLNQFNDKHRLYKNQNSQVEFKNPTIFQDHITRKNTFLNSFINQRAISPNDNNNFQKNTLNINQKKPGLTKNPIISSDSRKNLTKDNEETESDFEENIDFLRSQVFEFIKSNTENQRDQKIKEQFKQNLIRNEIIKSVLRDIFFSFENNGLITIQTAKSILIYLNERFKIPYTALDIDTFFTRVGQRYRGMFNFDEFCEAFEIF